MKRKAGNKSHYEQFQKNNKRLKKYCPGSGGDWGNFLHSSPYGAALLWICGKNSAGNTPVLWLLLSIACTASRLHFSSTLPAPATRPGVSKKLGEDTVGQNSPKLTLFQLTKKNGAGKGQISASGRWQSPLKNLFPLLSFPSLTVPLSQPFAVPVLFHMALREGGSSWAVLKLLARVSPGKLQNLGNFIPFFFQYTLTLQKKVFTQTDVSYI